jgi:hypothetical protein
MLTSQEEMKTRIDDLIPWMDTWHEETKACWEAMETCIGKTEAKIETDHEQINAKIQTGLEEVTAMGLEANSE